MMPLFIRLEPDTQLEWSQTILLLACLRHHATSPSSRRSGTHMLVAERAGCSGQEPFIDARLVVEMSTLHGIHTLPSGLGITGRFNYTPLLSNSNSIVGSHPEDGPGMAQSLNLKGRSWRIPHSTFQSGRQNWNWGSRQGCSEGLMTSCSSSIMCSDALSYVDGDHQMLVSAADHTQSILVIMKPARGALVEFSERKGKGMYIALERGKKLTGKRRSLSWAW